HHNGSNEKHGPARQLFVGAIVMHQNVIGADPNYAESVAMTGHSMDANTTFDVRIARFPASGYGTLWMYVYIDGRQFALVDESAELTDTEATDVSGSDSEFEVTGVSSATLSAEGRDTPTMHGRLQARGRLHAVAHPVPGEGEVPVAINAVFDADHVPIPVRPGRIEVMGRVKGSILVDGTAHQIDIPGKWHEQVGVRPQFAPAFTYLFVQGAGSGIMATRFAEGAWGYVYNEGTVRSIIAMDIAPYGATERAFTATLEDGSRLSGSARVVREVSVPIEGKRRPGATVLVESDMGPLVGVLNDWNPGQ
ncbi:MAG: hypothetical protein KDA21_10035, partial [Phycisphaerales bacterium]|nr:hypothetical protein [Phycisphaerales bacterium]